MVKRFPEIKGSKIIVYKNPSECSHLSIEEDPNNGHAVLWGNRKRKLRKTKGNNNIMIGKVYFNAFTIALLLSMTAFIDAFTFYRYLLLVKVGFASTCFYCAFSLILYYSIFNMDRCKKWISDYSLS